MDLKGEVGLPSLGCKRDRHPPQAVFNRPVRVAATSGEVGTREFLRSQYSHHSTHRCQFLQRA